MLFFLDESGAAPGGPPYDVLGGIAIQEALLWPYVQEVSRLELETFGMRLRDLTSRRDGLRWELKGGRLLQRDKFRYADQGPAIEPFRRKDLAYAFLQRGLHGETPRREEFTAYGQAVLAFVGRLLGAAADFGVTVFASMVEPNAPQPADSEKLRRDYAFLFERFFYYLEDTSPAAQGILVFDELERSQCLGVIQRMEDYFLRTENGRMRSSRIIPEPFFVHSDLTTAIQTADIVCYVLNWAYRFGKRMAAPRREELVPYRKVIDPMIYRRERQEQGGFATYGVFYLDDLRPVSEREP